MSVGNAYNNKNEVASQHKVGTSERKTMKKIIYRNQNEVENFDMKRFLDSVNKFAKISEKEATAALADFDRYETMHVSCLVEVGAKLIADKANAKKAEEYFNEHAEWFDDGKFERLRRITGYLVGTLDRWNDAKKAEEHDRVKHSVNSAIDDAERLAALETQAMAHNIAYATR